MKKDKIETQAFVFLVNKLLEKEIRKEDLLSDPDKVEQYAKILDESLDKIYSDSDRISDKETIEEKVDKILYYYRLLEYVCHPEKLEEIYALWEPRTAEKLKEMGLWETYNELEQYEELHDLSMKEDGSEDRLYTLMMKLMKCEDEKCGKWFVQTAKPVNIIRHLVNSERS